MTVNGTIWARFAAYIRITLIPWIAQLSLAMKGSLVIMAAFVGYKIGQALDKWAQQFEGYRKFMVKFVGQIMELKIRLTDYYKHPFGGTEQSRAKLKEDLALHAKIIDDWLKEIKTKTTTGGNLPGFVLPPKFDISGVKTPKPGDDGGAVPKTESEIEMARQVLMDKTRLWKVEEDRLGQHMSTVAGWQEAAAIKEAENIEKAAELEKTSWKDRLAEEQALRIENGQKNLATVNEFEELYKQTQMSAAAYEITQIDAMAEKYLEAGANRIAVAEWVAAKIKEVDDRVMEEAKNTLQKWTEDVITNLQMMNESIIYASNSFSNGFVDAITSADITFKDFARNFLRDIAKMIAKTILLNALKEGIGMIGAASTPTGTGITSVGGTMGIAGANGLVFNQAGLTPFAAGGIVNKPTVFPFAGGTGLMGEAGPEAIMPLKRGSGGKLGVESSGGSGGQKVINNNLTIQAVDSKSFLDLARRNPDVFTSIMNQEMERGNSALNSNIRKVAR